MSAIGFDDIRPQPGLRARLAAWIEGGRRRDPKTSTRSACAPQLSFPVEGVGGRAPAGACRTQVRSGGRRGAVEGCPRGRVASLLGRPAERPPCEIARELAAERQRGRRIEQAVSHYVSPHVLDRLLADPDGLGLGGEVRDVSVLFADIRGFTGLAEAFKEDPRRLAEVVAVVMEPLTEIVLAHGGVLDKYMGDCVMAFWGAPDADAGHADRALEAALAMQAATAMVNERLRQAFGASLPDISIGVGLNSGPCMVGNVGSRRRFDYSVLGDPVNVASRLQDLCKVYDVPLLVGEATAAKLGPNANLLELDRVVLRGRAEPQRIYAIA